MGERHVERRQILHLRRAPKIHPLWPQLSAPSLLAVSMVGLCGAPAWLLTRFANAALDRVDGAALQRSVAIMNAWCWAKTRHSGRVPQQRWRMPNTARTLERIESGKALHEKIRTSS